MATRRPRRDDGWWWRIGGSALWGATVGVLVVATHSDLVPATALLVSCLVPLGVVLSARLGVIRTAGPTPVILALAVGGASFIVGASLVEADLPSAGWVALLTGTLKELAKVVVVVSLGWRVLPKVHDGALILFAALGIGALLVVAGLVRRHQRGACCAPAAHHRTAAR